ncbi:MAG: glucosamine-6-phosphate deaminase [Planctomycetaceae bacterium]|nr:glucosamine-6-phosphate deaminase [Planctomycetaceae bacterium]
MYISRFNDKVTLGQSAASLAATTILDAIETDGKASIILATGASQFEMLSALVAVKAIDWSKVEVFHLDEYIGLPISHPASFRKYLRERFVEKVSNLGAFHEVRGDASDPVTECQRLGNLIKNRKIVVACVGIGENGHLAFNDPPANFETEEPYIIVDLDEKCRRQQLGEGWFPTLDDVPKKAISMSCRQILRAEQIVCTVPDLRKAEAVRDAVYGDVSPEVPASILQKHPDCTLFLDVYSASLLERIA